MKGVGFMGRTREVMVGFLVLVRYGLIDGDGEDWVSTYEGT